MAKAPCRGIRKDGQPCGGNGVAALDGYCIAHAPADVAREWRIRGGKATATASRIDKRIPDRLRGIVDMLTEGMAEVRAGTLQPSAYAAMCGGAKALIDLYQQADAEMELIRHEEGEAAAADIAGAHGDLAILNAAAAIVVRQNKYRIEALTVQGLITSELDRLQDALDGSAPMLTEAGRQRFGSQRMFRYRQDDIDELKRMLSGAQTQEEREELQAELEEIQAFMERALAGGPGAPDLVRDALTGEPMRGMPASVKAAGGQEAGLGGVEQAETTLVEQIEELNALAKLIA